MRLYVLVFCFFALIFGAAYTTYWFYAASRISETLNTWQKGQSPMGFVLSSETSPQISGYPLSFTILMGPTTITEPSRLPEAKITVPNLHAWSRPWSSKSWRFEMPRGAHFTAPSIQAVLDSGAIEGEIGQNTLQQIQFVDTTVTSGQIEGRLFRRPVGSAAVNIRFSIPRIPSNLHTDEALRFQIAIERTHLPGTIEPLGNIIGHLALTGALDGSIPRQPLVRALQGWRDSGGTIEIRDLKLDWGPLSLTGDGTVALDNAMQPIGAFSTRILNYNTMVDAIAASGRLDPGQAAFVRTGLDLLAQRDEEGRLLLKTPLTMQDGRLSIGPAKLMKLPQLVWQN